MQANPGIAAQDVGRLDLSEMGPDCYSIHRANGEALLINANAVSLYGADPDAMLGRAYLDAVRREDRAAVRDAIAGCSARGEQLRVQFRMAASAGRASENAERWFELHCAPFAAAALGIADVEPLVMGVARDVTERRKLDEELRNAREIADSANIAKSRFLANMSHELRTPLNAILGFSELLQSDILAPLSPEKQREYVFLIHSSAGHLLNILNDVLDMSKIDAGKYEIFPERFDLDHTLLSCCDIMRGQAQKKNITITYEQNSALPEIIADERAIKQVMINLLSNAVKFTGQGGEVRVVAQYSGRKVAIAIADTGIGISPQHMGRLGMPFYQADSKFDRKYEGTGLGLSVVFGLVELHRGKVKFASRKNQGTKVTVTLPNSVVRPAAAGCADRPKVGRVGRNPAAAGNRAIAG